MPKKLLVLIVILSIAGLVYLQYSQDNASLEPTPLLLRLQMQPGDWVKVKQTEQLHFKEEKFLVGMYFNIQMEMESTLTCTQRDANGVMTIDQTWDTVWLSLVSSNGTIEYNSQKSNKAVPQEARQYEAIIGKTITLRITPEGDLLDYQGAAQLAEATMMSVKRPKARKGGKEARLAIEAMLEDFKQRLTKNFIQSRQYALPAMFRWYPEDELQAGQSWTTIGRCMADRPGDETAVMTYEGLHDDQAYFDVESTLEATDSVLDQMQFQSISAASEFGNNLTASGQGRVCVDIKTGLIRKAKIEGTGTMLTPRGLAGQLWDSSEKRVLNGTIKSELEILEEYLQ